MTFGGGFFVNVVSLKYIGILYINVGEMCFIEMNVHNELLNGVRQLRLQHISPVVLTFSTSIRTQVVILLFHKALHPPSLFLYLSLYPSVCLPTPSCFPN